MCPKLILSLPHYSPDLLFLCRFVDWGNLQQKKTKKRQQFFLVIVLWLYRSFFNYYYSKILCNYSWYVCISFFSFFNCKAFHWMKPAFTWKGTGQCSARTNALIWCSYEKPLHSSIWLSFWVLFQSNYFKMIFFKYSFV